MKPNSNQPAEQDAAQYAFFDVRALYEVVRGRLWLIAGCALGGLLLGGFYVATHDLFEATATVQVEEENPVVAPIQDVTKEDFRQPEDLKTVEQQLLARTLLWRVIQANKLDQGSAFFKPGILHRILGQPVSRDGMINSLAKSFKVKQNRGTRLIDITVKDENPKTAQTLARSLIDEYVNQNIEWRASPSKEANKFLIDEAERLKKMVQAAENALQEYREQNHAVSLEEKQNIVVDRLKDLNLRAAQAQNDTAALESDLAQLEKFGRQTDKLIAIGSIAAAQSVIDAQRMAAGKEAAFALLRQRYGPENPAYAQAERELQQVRATLDVAVLNAADSLRAKHEAAKITQQAAEKTLREQEASALDLNRKATRYAELTREVEANHALFAALIKRLNEMGVMEHINQVHLRVVDPPMLPDSPSLMSKALIVALGFFGGGAMAFCGVVARFVVKPSIQSPDHAARVLGFPALGAIPRLPRLTDASRIPGISAPRSQAAEAFRFLTASASALVGTEGKGSLLITSAASGDGSTSCAAGCAVALARSGVRTLLVDANFRSPSIGRIFSAPKSAAGLAECLAGRSDLATSAFPTKVENLSVLAAGSVPAEISCLFSGAAFSGLLAKALDEYAQVVIDSAPVNLASETVLIARHVSASCLVVATGRTTTGSATRASELLESSGRPPAACIASRVPRRLLA